MKKFDSKSCEEIMTTVYKPIEFVVDNMIAQGLYILAGAPKVGKSWLSLDICLSIAKGEKVLGQETSMGTVLYLCLEDSFERIQKRLYELTDEPTDRLYFAIMSDSIGHGLEEQIHRYCGLIKCAECGAILIAKRRQWRDTEWVEYTCNSHHRYGKEYCTPHRIHETQLDTLIYGEVKILTERIVAESEKYNKIVKDWLRQKPMYERKIKQYKERIAVLQNQVEEIIMERIADREHTSIYNNMIAKREEEITDLQNKIEESRRYDEVSRQKRDSLKSTSDLLKDILSESKISDANLRMLVKQIYVHQNEDKSLDVRFEFNGDFEDSEVVYIEKEKN